MSPTSAGADLARRSWGHGLDPQPPPEHWWQHPWVRLMPAVVAVVGVCWLELRYPETKHVHVHLTHWTYFVLTPADASGYAALLLLPFLRKVSYRKRDALLIWLVPLYGQLLIGLMIFRLMALPRRTWPPRRDELARVARIPGGRGAYVLRPTFEAAEQLRRSWCRNADHRHPYPSWEEAQQSGCRQSRGAVPEA